MSNRISKHRLLAQLCFVTSGRSWVKQRRLMERNPFTQLVVQQVSNVPRHVAFGWPKKCLTLQRELSINLCVDHFVMYMELFPLFTVVIFNVSI